MRCASGMLLGITMHEESTAAEGFGAGYRIQLEDVGPVIAGIGGWADDGPISLRDRPDVGDILQRRIILARACAGISSCDGLAVLLEFTRLLCVRPRESIDVDAGACWQRVR